jgi:hypothetical protein
MMHERTKSYTRRLDASALDDEEVLLFGHELYEALFSGAVRRFYDDARARRARPFTVVIKSMVPWIVEKPWELAYDGSRRSFVALESLLFRSVVSSVPADAVHRGDGPLRILVASAQPFAGGARLPKTQSGEDDKH